MLNTVADFPHPGAIAWLRPEPGRDTAERVRILEADTGKGLLIAFTGLPPRGDALGGKRPAAHSMPASGNRRVPLALLAATRDEALAPPAKPKPPRQRKAAAPKPRRARAERTLMPIENPRGAIPSLPPTARTGPGEGHPLQCPRSGPDDAGAALDDLEHGWRTDPLILSLSKDARAYARRLDDASALFGFAVALAALLWFLTASIGAERPSHNDPLILSLSKDGAALP